MFVQIETLHDLALSGESNGGTGGGSMKGYMTSIQAARQIQVFVKWAVNGTFV